MTKCLLCLGQQTDNIAESLDYNVNGIELISCSDISKLDKIIKNSGKIDTIILSQTGIENGEIPQSIIENNSWQVLIIAKDKQLLQNLDITYFGYNNINLIDLGDTKFTTRFLKQLIVAPTTFDYMYYKGDTFKDEEPQEELQEPEIKEEQQETPVLNLDREVETEDQEETPSSPFNTSDSPTIDLSEPETQRQLELSDDNIQAVPIVDRDKLLENRDKINKALKYYPEGVIIANIGLPKTFATTTALNMAKYFASIDNTVSIIDLDVINYPLSVLNKDLVAENKMQESNTLEQVLNTRTNMLLKAMLLSGNLQVLTGTPFSNSIEKNFENIKKYSQLLDINKNNYNVIILDLHIDDIYIYKDLLLKCNKIIFYIEETNKDYLSLMRYLSLADEDLREKLFNQGQYIQIGQDKKLLNTSLKTLEAIDKYMEQNSIINNLKFGDIKKIGTILKQDKYPDYLESSAKIKEKEIENILLRMFDVA